VNSFSGGGLEVAGALPWMALLAVALALAFLLLDTSAHWTLAGFYLVGLSGFGLWFGGVPTDLRWMSVPGLALYVSLCSICYRAGRRLSLAERTPPWPAAWFPPIQLLLAVSVTVLSVVLCLVGATTGQRFGGPLAVACLLPAVLLLTGRQPASEESQLPDWARQGYKSPRPPDETSGFPGQTEFSGSSRRPLTTVLAQSATLFLFALLLVETAWTGLDAHGPTAWLEGCSWMFAIFALLTLVYGVLLPRFWSVESGWPALGRRAGVIVGFLAVGLLVAVLAQEVVLTQKGVAPLLPGPVLTAVAAALILLIVAGLCFALLAGLDPLNLSERGRTAYVFAGEVLLFVLLVHFKLTLPQLFTGRLGEHWTFVVIGIAFAGALVSEWLGWLGVKVLAQPLRQTSVFLPLLPVLAFWVRPVGDYSTLWFLLGLLYALLSLTRRSLGFLLLAACAGNVGLWVVLHENQKAFIHYPQLWLVPLALTVLVGAHLNRDRLNRRQMNTLRYFALTVIYLASTAETFVQGLGQDVWRPLLLVVLSLTGVFVGMWLRIRAFLFLGTGFLGMGVLALVWHAATQQNWIWYVAGIILGILIIVLFAVFEKRRNDVLQLLEKLREWE